MNILLSSIFLDNNLDIFYIYFFSMTSGKEGERDYFIKINSFLAMTQNINFIL